MIPYISEINYTMFWGSEYSFDDGMPLSILVLT